MGCALSATATGRTATSTPVDDCRNTGDLKLPRRYGRTNGQRRGLSHRNEKNALMACKVERDNDEISHMNAIESARVVILDRPSGTSKTLRADLR